MLSIQEYNTIVKLYADRLYRYAVKSTGENTTADDVVQNTFLKLWQNKDTVTVETSKGLLFKMAHQNVIDMYRSNTARQKRETQVQVADIQPSQNYELTELLQKAFEKLPPQHRSLILLRDYEGYTYEEIAEMQAISLAKVKVYLYRARKQMQEILQQLEA